LAEFAIAELGLGNGTIGISPLPGRGGAYLADLARVLRWSPSLVLTMVTVDELERAGADRFGDDLEAAGIGWHHLPIPDFSAPPEATAALWPEASDASHEALAQGGKVLAHCYGGCGRSGMALLRLMVEAGEDADPALKRLREVRACAVEAESQRAWASVPMIERNGWAR
jgi:protein-tyrosine phosphatase